ncbi:MAG: hypothetical protein U1F25_16505 [Rubrivivax sp.]
MQSAAALLHGVAQARHTVQQPACTAPGFGANPPWVSAAATATCAPTARASRWRCCTRRPRSRASSPAPAWCRWSARRRRRKLAHEGFEVHAAGDGVQVRLRGGSDAMNCAFVYRAPAALGQAPELSPALTAGC